MCGPCAAPGETSDVPMKGDVVTLRINAEKFSKTIADEVMKSLDEAGFVVITKKRLDEYKRSEAELDQLRAIVRPHL